MGEASSLESLKWYTLVEIEIATKMIKTYFRMEERTLLKRKFVNSLEFHDYQIIWRRMKLYWVRIDKGDGGNFFFLWLWKPEKLKDFHLIFVSIAGGFDAGCWKEIIWIKANFKDRPRAAEI